MEPMKHQIVFSEKLYQLVKSTGYAYLSGKPRSGKTYTAILACELSDREHNILVLTKKNAISGWLKFIEGNDRLKHRYTVTNYEQAHKLKPEYTIAIIDESHNLGSFPKPSQRVQAIRKLCFNIPHIHLSGTAIVESPMSIYHQMFISKYNPFSQFRNFYDFHRFYGKPKTLYFGGREVKDYSVAKPELLPEIDKFTIYMTQEDAGIDKELQAVDKLHYIELNEETKKLYNQVQKDRLLEVEDKTLVCDTTMKLRTSLHMIESGVVKLDDEYIFLGNTEKIDYIKKTFGDNEAIGIMCHFVGERMLLEKHFKNAKIYSSTSHAEGVDLSHLKHFIILSSDYSGAKFIQRRERIVNVNGSNTLTVHHILVKKAISEQVYNTVSKKMDFNNSTYERKTI